MYNKEFWIGKSVRVIGGASFIGSHLLREMAKLGCRVFVHDDFSSGSVLNMPKSTVFNDSDMRSYKEALKATSGADIVIDLASVHGGRGFVGTNHEVAISDNFIINTNILKAAVYNGVERYFFASSGCVYPTFLQMDDEIDQYIPEKWLGRNDPMSPDGMYGLTKAAHEKTIRAYHDDGLIKTAVCRFFTVFGRRMKENHFILASIAKSFIKQDPFYVWGTGTEVRNFTPVQNTVQGLLLATEKANGEPYNIGLEQRITIDEALESIWKIMDWRPNEIVHLPDKPVGIRNRVSDCTKAKTELGWNPTVSFEEGLKDTIQWYIETHNVDEVKKDLERKLTER